MEHAHAGRLRVAVSARLPGNQRVPAGAEGHGSLGPCVHVDTRPCRDQAAGPAGSRPSPETSGSALEPRSVCRARGTRTGDGGSEPAAPAEQSKQPGRDFQEPQGPFQTWDAQLRGMHNCVCVSELNSGPDEQWPHCLRPERIRVLRSGYRTPNDTSKERGLVNTTNTTPGLTQSDRKATREKRKRPRGRQTGVSAETVRRAPDSQKRQDGAVPQ